MGPFSDELQHKRANSIKKLIANKSLDPIYVAMWKRKLFNLAQNEDEYNARVVKIYKQTKSGITYAE